MRSENNVMADDMVRIKNYKHKSSRHIKNYHVIMDENEVYIQSLAALVLLNDDLNNREEKDSELEKYLDIRHEWLSSFSVLTCHYCGKTPLEVGERELSKAYINNANPMLATVDHKIPVSAGCEHNDCIIKK